LRVFAPIVIAAMAAVVVRDLFLGDEPIFLLPDYTLYTLWELLPFAVLGILGAIASWSVLQLVGLCQKFWQSVPLPNWMRPACAGFVIGVIALQYPLILSVGTDGIGQALRGELFFNLLFAFLFLKIIAVAIAIGSGFAGGVFGPALYIGAMLGGCFWWFLTFIGAPISDQGVYAIAGTAAVASAMLGAPISMGAQRQRLAMIVDEEGVFHGSVTLQQLVAYAVEQGMDHAAIAVATNADFSATTSTNIVTALQRMAEQQVEYLPVLDLSDKTKPLLLGTISKSDLLAEHYDVVKREREAEFGIT